MSKKWFKCKSKMLTVMLTWLGIGTSSLLFMACYGPAPKNYEPEPYPIEIEESDSIETAETADTTAVAPDLP